MPFSSSSSRRRRSGVSPALILPALFALACGSWPATPAHGAALVEAGEPAAVLVVPEAPADAEREAAEELIEHIELMSGATLETMTAEAHAQSPGELTPIRIGAAADAGLEARIRADGDLPWSFALIVEDEQVQLRGLTPGGTRAAAYELLEQLGVRWYMPGEIGRVVPERDTLLLDPQQSIEVPDFRERRGPSTPGGGELWSQRLRLDAPGRRYGRHGIPGSPDFDEHPEAWALIDGERVRRQLCLTNSTDDLEANVVLQSVVAWAREHLEENPDTEVLHMGPRDGGGFCQCEHCQALDPPASVTTPLMTPQPSHTDRYVWFFNQLTEALADEHPDVLIGFYAYGGLMRPPHAIEPRNNLAISLAPIHVCRIHGPNNPVCPESNLVSWLYEAWEPYVERIWDRGYLFNLAEPGLPFSMVHRVREEIPLAHDNNVIGWSADPSSAWASHHPSMYVTAKLLWDHTTDVDALLEDFYARFYGPASEPMAAYHELMDAIIRDADHHTGGAWDMPHIYPEPVRREARSHLERAASLAAAHADAAYGTRVEIMRKSLDFLDAFCDLMEHRHAFEFEAERASLREFEAIRDSLLEDYEYPMLHPRHAQRLLDRFTRRMTLASYETTRGESEIVARFDHQWGFQLDPESWGRNIGLHKPESEGGNWQTIRTDTSWSNQGLRYYFGQSWYRQTVDVPAAYEDRPVHIWFAGVDRTAEVWINGQFVGANHDGAAFDLDAHGSAFEAFEFDTSDAIDFGGPNVVVVRQYRSGTSELGTGGIIGPVMFYVPDR